MELIGHSPYALIVETMKPERESRQYACCGGCIAFHVHGALKAGATRQEVLETIGVALMMGGGPASVYAAEAYEALGQFEKANVQ
jgi:alkylhydroperoxidase/carboxymuconolactone decarboxylase family protein YurZ